MIDSEFYVWVSGDGYCTLYKDGCGYPHHLVTLSGGAAVLARDWFAWHTNPPERATPYPPYDVAGVLADRVEEFPHEAVGEERKVRLLVAYMRMQFTDRINPFRGLPHHQR